MERNETTLRQTLRISNIEGILSQVYAAVAGPGSIFMTKFAVMLGAGAIHFGILAAIGQLSQLFQPVGSAVTRNAESRKSAVLRLLLAGRAPILCIAFLPFVFSESTALWVFLMVYFIGVSIQAAGTNVWVGWMSSMVPLRFRGRFFALRTRYLMVTGLATGFLLGGFLDLFDEDPGWMAIRFNSIAKALEGFHPGNMDYGFAAVFLGAVVFGYAGIGVLSRQPERNKARDSEGLVSLLSAPLRDKNFRKLLMYGLWWMLAVGIGAPFWQPFMIKNLSMSLVQIQVYGMIAAIASLGSLRLWGFLIDHLGNKPCMRVALILGGMNPMIWLFAGPGNYWIIYFEAFSSGLMWAGAGIIATNFVLSVSPKGREQEYSGVFGAFSGLAMMLTIMLSGIFLPPPLRFSWISLDSEQVLFGLSGLARWTALIPLTWVVEARAKPMGQVMFYLRQFAKVRVAHLAEWRFRRRH